MGSPLTEAIATTRQIMADNAPEPTKTGSPYTCPAAVSGTPAVRLRRPTTAAALDATADGYLFRAQAPGFCTTPDAIGAPISPLLGEHYTTHGLRHATRAYARHQGPIRAVQEMLGHSKPETTARYTAVPDGAESCGDGRWPLRPRLAGLVPCFNPGMSIEDQVRAELGELDWKDVLQISEDADDGRQSIADQVMRETMKPLTNLLASQLYQNRSELGEAIKAAGMGNSLTGRLRAQGGVSKLSASLANIMTPMITMPKMKVAGSALGMLRPGFDQKIFANLSRSSEELRESTRRSVELIQQWTERDWSAADRLTDMLVDDTEGWPDKVDAEVEEVARALEPAIEGQDRGSKIRSIMTMIVVVYLTILADRTVPDREQLYTLLQALIHLARSLPR